MANLNCCTRLCAVFLLSALTSITLSAQQFKDLLTFNGANGGNPGLDPMIQGADGSFYGTTQYGGSNTCGAVTCGTVFKITPAGKLTTLYNFCAQPKCADGANPGSGLILATDGNFYGATYFYGGNGYGTVFKITPTGKLTTLHSFCSQANCADGANPMGRLLQARDGNFYGTTTSGGSTANCCGTIFKVSPGGILTTIHVVSPQDFGDTPSPGLVEGADGNFFGIFVQGGNQDQFCNGSPGCGAVFKITPTGVLTTLYAFCSQSACSDGANPGGPLVLGTDGNFYGTTSFEGGHGAGNVFKLTPQGNLTTIYSFCPGTSCADGAFPTGALIQATDGAFYGTASQGGIMTGRCATHFSAAARCFESLAGADSRGCTPSTWLTVSPQSRDSFKPPTEPSTGLHTRVVTKKGTVFSMAVERFSRYPLFKGDSSGWSNNRLRHGEHSHGQAKKQCLFPRSTRLPSFFFDAELFL